jgi:ABC-type transport system involved in multi-copper enzyme maturation permease subunit
MKLLLLLFSSLFRTLILISVLHFLFFLFFFFFFPSCVRFSSIIPTGYLSGRYRFDLDGRYWWNNDLTYAVGEKNIDEPNFVFPPFQHRYLLFAHFFFCFLFLF